MTGDVVQFRPRRPALAEGLEDLLACPTCGSVWLGLGWFDGDGEFHGGAVCVNQAGSVTGYSGVPCCVTCVQEVLP